jgi:hypothetical protein
MRLTPSTLLALKWSNFNLMYVRYFQKSFWNERYLLHKSIQALPYERGYIQGKHPFIFH